MIRNASQVGSLSPRHERSVHGVRKEQRRKLGVDLIKEEDRHKLPAHAPRQARPQREHAALGDDAPRGVRIRAEGPPGDLRTQTRVSIRRGARGGVTVDAAEVGVAASAAYIAERSRQRSREARQQARTSPCSTVLIVSGGCDENVPAAHTVHETELDTYSEKKCTCHMNMRGGESGHYVSLWNVQIGPAMNVATSRAWSVLRCG